MPCRQPRLTASTGFAAVLVAIVLVPSPPLASDEARPPTPPDLRSAAGAPPLADDLATNPDGPSRPRADRAVDAGRAGRARIPDADAMVRRAIATGRSDVGGTDVRVADDVEFGLGLVEVDDAGRIFVAVRVLDPDADTEFVEVYRSTDAGTSFTLWSTIGGGSDAQYLEDLDVASGSYPRVFVTTRARPGLFEVQVAWADPAATNPVWVTRQPFPSDTSYSQPQLDIDDRSFDAYYCYLVAARADGDGDDIWFTRSTDQGGTWSDAYAIGSLGGDGSTNYVTPSISYGHGGIVHVAWTYREIAQGPLDHAVRYRRAIDYASDPGDWQAGITAITSAGDGADDTLRDVQASLDDPTVILGYTTTVGDPLRLRASDDGGATWPVTEAASLPWEGGLDLEYRRAGVEFVASGYLGGPFDRDVSLSRAIVSAPLAWSTPQVLSDVADLYSATDLGLDPSRDERAAVCFTLIGGDISDIVHDAEWRGDPGFPNPEPSFPRPLDATAISPPALVDLDDDGDLEIVFGDAADNVQALHHDGQPLAGWPRAVPGLSATPVAVGVLGHEEPSVVAGTDAGEVYAFAPDGELRDGWPASLPVPGETHVSIGALGGPYPRVVVAMAGDRLAFLNYRGVAPPGASVWTYTTGAFAGPAAFGDIDGDGVSEVVVATGGWVHAREMLGSTTDMLRLLPAATSAPVSLADLDFDGLAEVIAPTESGQLFVLDEGGSDHPGFPFSSPTGSRLTAAAVANVLGGAAPEIAFSAYEWTTHLVYQDGDEQSGYPVEPGTGWYAIAAPIMGRVDGFSGDVATASRGGDVWAFDNFGNVVDGWPQPMGGANQVELSPAMGDVDLDGRNEIVVLDRDIVVIDVGSEPHDAASTWAMYAHDAGRTGCADCPEDVATAVDPDDPRAVTRVRFTGAGPNPIAAAGTRFRFAVPVRASAELVVYDVRGRRVRALLRREVPAGEHVVAWDGQDRAGRRVASGHYLARLRVTGPGVQEELTRSVTVVR
jgi:hypothetical protein